MEEEKNESTQQGTPPLSFDPHFLDPLPSPIDHVVHPSYDPETYDTQATQLVVDPRRLGQQGGSGLSDEDVADICCILHPLTMPAYKAAADVYTATPRHAICADNNGQIRENNTDANDVEEYQLISEDLVACDIALRLSSQLKDPLAGFVFGRHRARCDIVMGEHQESRRISNVHFRIHINEYGVIMLEDQSTNGTAVDGTLLRGKDKENGQNYRHTLQHGSVIVLTMTPPEVDFRFVVRVPQRNEESDNAYQENLRAYLLRIKSSPLENGAPMAGTTEPVRELLCETMSMTNRCRLTCFRLRLQLQIQILCQPLVEAYENGRAVTSITRSATLARALLPWSTRSQTSLMASLMLQRSLRRDVL